MKKNIINILKEIHYCLPPWIRATNMYVINQIGGLKYFVLPVHIYKGKEKNSGETLSIIYLGWDLRIATYWTSRFLVKHYSEQENKKIPVWKVPEYLDAIKKSLDLAIVEMNFLTRRFAGINFGFLLPRWFEMQIIPKELVNSNRNLDIKRRIRKFSLDFKKEILYHNNC